MTSFGRMDVAADFNKSKIVSLFSFQKVTTPYFPLFHRSDKKSSYKRDNTACSRVIAFLVAISDTVF